MYKVYFAKSNACLSKKVACVRQYLKENNDVEIVEWNKAGSYSNEPLIASDFLVVLPAEARGGERIWLGKGLYTQIEKFTESHPIENVLIVTDVNNDVTRARRIDSMKVVDRTDWTDYGIVNLKSTNYEVNSEIKDSMREKYGYGSYDNGNDMWGRRDPYYDSEMELRMRRDMERNEMREYIERLQKAKAEDTSQQKRKAQQTSEDVGKYLNGEQVLNPDIDNSIYLLLR